MLNAMQRGFTLVELFIGLMIVAMLLAMAAPSFSSWIQNTQIRTTAEAVQNGLQLARAEAVRRNTLISFQLVTTLDSTCALSTAGPNWVVSLVASPSSLTSAASACNQAPNSPPADPAVLAVATDPYIVQKFDGTNTARNVVIAAGQSAINFNGLGRVAPTVTADIDIDITNPAGGVCKEASGPMRCLRLLVSPSGQIRMCDPAIASSNPPNPQGCT